MGSVVVQYRSYRDAATAAVQLEYLRGLSKILAQILLAWCWVRVVLELF